MCAPRSHATMNGMEFAALRLSRGQTTQTFREPFMNPVTSTASRPGHGPGHALSRSRAASRGLPGSVVIRRMFTGLLLMAAALLIVPAVQAASSGGSADKPVVEQLLNAIAQNDYQ